MARKPRIVWELGLYHITVRGNNKQGIFNDGSDFARYLAFLAHYKNKFKFKLYAFVLMLNHVHLLIETTEDASISKIMKVLNQRYALWYNLKYNRKGHLWENRFHSNIVERDSYLLECIRYIEINPIRAKLVASLEDYKWSSYTFRIKNEPFLQLDTHPIFTNFEKSTQEIYKNYKKFISEALMVSGTS
ncbi:MAG: transposase [Candidatus Omnitrophica bacterium]|nr:transposase [Candidatus Omnitrophota bacterium]